MAGKDTGGTGRADRLADQMDVDAATKLLQWASATDGAGHPRSRSYRRRMALVRKAFVGDVRMSFTAVLALAMCCASGWVGAHFWYHEAHRHEIERVRAEAARDGALQVLTFISRVQESPEADARLLEAGRIIYEAMYQNGLDINRIGHDQ